MFALDRYVITGTHDGNILTHKHNTHNTHRYDLRCTNKLVSDMAPCTVHTYTIGISERDVALRALVLANMRTVSH